MIDESDPVCAEFVAYRGAIPAGEVIEHGGLDTIRYWVGPNLHLIQYPLRHGELYNQVAVFKSYHYRVDFDDWGTADELEEHFAKTHESVRRALLKVKRDRRWPLYDRLPADNWTPTTTLHSLEMRLTQCCNILRKVLVRHWKTL